MNILTATVALACGLLVIWGYHKGWPVRSLLFYGFLSLWFDPTDSLILDKLDRWKR